MPDDRVATDVVARVLLVLRAVGERPHGATLTEIARCTAIPLSSTYRLLSSLGQDDFVRFDGVSKRYSLGLRVFQLASLSSHALGFDGLAMPVLRRISARTEETTLMAARDGDRLLYVHYIEGARQVGVTGEPGKHGPLHCTAMGKVLVAHSTMPQREELVETLELRRYASSTIVDRAAFRREIEAAVTNGYATADAEHEAGIVAIAVPVRRGDETAEIAISVAAPAYRMTLGGLKEFLPILNEAAQELAYQLPAGR